MSNQYEVGQESYIDAKADFILKTYGHLFGAILAFTGLEILMFQTGVAENIAIALLSAPGGWLVVLGGFMLTSWIASRMAHAAKSTVSQYSGLGLFIVAEAIIFVPMLYIADTQFPGVIANAAAVTLLGFAGLTAIVFISRKNFSFLRPFLMWGGLLALGGIAASALMGFQLGMIFTIAMIGFAGAAILYDTSNVLHEFQPGQHVAASLQLFSSVALLFWYVLQFFMSGDD